MTKRPAASDFDERAQSFAERRSRVRMQEGNGEHVLADPPADPTLSECFASTDASENGSVRGTRGCDHTRGSRHSPHT